MRQRRIAEANVIEKARFDRCRGIQSFSFAIPKLRSLRRIDSRHARRLPCIYTREGRPGVVARFAFRAY